MARSSVLSISIYTLVCTIGVLSFVPPSGDYNRIGRYFPYLYYKGQDKVDVRLYYESLCPDCIAEYPQLPPLVRKLGPYIQLTTLPYGNAKMQQINGTTVIQCQHGEPECYGNKLHACAIDYLQDTQAFVDYNACLMKYRSNDQAADICGPILRVNSGPIKQCAKGERGLQLLKYYGDESGKVTYKGVPFVLINGKPKPLDQPIWNAVCEAFVTPPPECKKMYLPTYFVNRV